MQLFFRQRAGGIVSPAPAKRLPASGQALNAGGTTMHDARLEAELWQARQGRSMVAVWRVQNGRLLLYRRTQDFPVADFAQAVQLLRENLQQAVASRPTTPLWLPPDVGSRRTEPAAAGDEAAPEPVAETSGQPMPEATHNGAPAAELPGTVPAAPVEEPAAEEPPAGEETADTPALERSDGDENEDADAVGDEPIEPEGKQAP